jgi:hypothetical protein
MNLRAVLCLLFWPFCALAHQSGNSYLTLTSDAQRFAVQADFAVRDLPTLLQMPGISGTNLGHEQVKALAPRLATLIAESLRLDVDGSAVNLRFDEQRMVVRNDGIYVSQRHVAPPLPSGAGNLRIQYLFFSEEQSVARAFVKLNANGTETSAVFDARHSTQRLALRDIPLSESLGTYLREGMLHTWGGPDHLLFLLCLLLPGLSLASSGLRPMGLHALKVVTAFTVAHSITLAAAAADWIVLPGKVVEAGIAASIIVAAGVVLRSPSTAYQWKLALVFGLIHGLGFASGLREWGLSSEHFISALLAFNLGVEFGQLVALACAALLVTPWLRSATAVGRLQVWGAWFNLLLATGWLLERLA